MHLWKIALSGVPFLSHSLLAQSTFICSTQNTGSGFTPVYAQFQSMGACDGTCASYSFAIVQGFECWCSNFFPSIRSDSSTCDTPCPGYDRDNCGGTLNGAFAYYQLAQASGTQAASSSTTSTTSSSSSSSSTPPTMTTSTKTSSSTTPTTVQPVTVIVTQTPSTQSGLTSSTIAGTSAPSSSTSKTTATASSTRSSSSVASNLQTGSAQEALQSQGKDGFFDSPGKVAGTFVAVGIIAAGIIAGILFLLFRRRNHRRSGSAMAVAGLNRKTSSSSTIENVSAFSHDGRSRSGSSSGLMAYGREKTSGGTTSPIAANWPIDDSGIAPVPVDQRLNPRPILMRFDSNYSRHSLRDEEDYSRRVLTVVNPDSRN